MIDHNKNPLFNTGTPKLILDKDLKIKAINDAFAKLFPQIQERRENILEVLDIKSTDGKDLNSEDLPKNGNIEIEVKNVDETITNLALTITQLEREDVLWEVFDVTEKNKIIADLQKQVIEVESKSKELMAELEKLKTVIHNSQDGFYVFDVDEKQYESLSPSLRTILNYSEEEFKEIKRKGLHTIIHPDDKEKFQEYWKNMSAGIDTEGTIYFRMRRKGDGWIYLSDRHTLVRDEAGKVVKIVGNVRDVSKQKAREENMDLLLKTLRHDVINKLSVIVSGTRTLLDPKRGDEEKLSCKKEMGNTIKIVNNIIVSISKSMEAIRENKELMIVNLTEVLQNIHETSSLNVKLVNMKKCSVLANDSVYSVINNIVDNANRHGEVDDVEITLVIRESSDWVQLKIFNPGKHIPDVLLRDIFKANFTHGENGNTGHGLYAVNSLMESYQGHVTPINEPEGGVSFILHFKKVGVHS